MEMGKTLRELASDTSFLDTLYGWVYNRAYNRDEVDDIVHDIVIALLVASQYHDTDYTYAYVWKTAENVHANHERKKYRSSRNVQELDEFCVNTSAALYEDSFEERIIGKIVDAEMYDKIMRETAFLSKIYRDVMVMFYFNELPVSEIAKRLDIPENRVRQRLFSAREKIKNNLSGKETNKKMNTNTMIQPYSLSLPGTGSPTKSKIDDVLRPSLFMQNILIACREKAKTPSEIASDTGIPTAYVENALYQMNDEMIIKTNDGKYISNILIADAKVREITDNLLQKIAVGYTEECLEAAKKMESEVFAWNKYGKQYPLEYYLWILLPYYADNLGWVITNSVTERYSDIEKDVRDYYAIGFMMDPNEKYNQSPFYSLYGNGENKTAEFRTFAGGLLPNASNRVFYTGVSDEVKIITKTIGGLSADSVSEEDAPNIARALELCYIIKEGDKYYPNIPIASRANPIPPQSKLENKKYADMFTDEYVKIIEKYVPKHMYKHIEIFVSITTNSIRHFIIEEAIKRGALYQPEPTGTEGMWCTIAE